MSMSDFGLLPRMTANHRDYASQQQTAPPHLHPLASALFHTHFTFAASPIPQTTSKPKGTTLPSRPQLLSWFRALPREELLAATAIDNPEFIDKFLKNYPTHNHQLLHLPSSRHIHNPFPPQNQHRLPFLTKVRVAVLAEPLIYLDSEQCTAQETLEWLEGVSGGRALDLPCRSINREKPQQNLLWFNSATFHPIEQWLASQLEKAIVGYYFSPRDRVARLKTLRKHIYDKKVAKDYAQVLELTLAEIQGGKLEEKAKLIDSLRGYEQTLQCELQQNILDLATEKKKKRKKRTKKDRHRKQPIQVAQSELYIEDEQEQSIPLLGLSPQESEMPRIVQQYATNQNYDHPDEFQLSQYAIPQQTVERFDGGVVESDCLSCSNLEKIAWSVNSTNYTSPAKNKQDFVQNEEGSCEDMVSFEMTLNDSFETVKLNRQGSHQIISSLQQQGQNHNSDTFLLGEHAELKSQRRRKRKPHKPHHKVVDQFKDKAIASILNKQFTSMVDSLSTQSNSIFESKAIAFERVQYFVKSLYAVSEAVLFGSNAVGLALPSSDIDIMLVHIPCQSKEDICDALAQIAIYINTMGWVTSCSTYFNAKVPLLKLQIDPSVSYFTPKRKTDYLRVNNPYLSYYLDMKQPSKGVPVKVDITISTEGGNVSGSTQLMRYWLQQKPSLQRVLLALKYSLSVRGYSENFKGGIGSYCLFVMVAAYFLHHNQSRQQSDCEILLDVLKYYGEEFQNQLKIITLDKEGHCFVDNEQGQQKYEISDQMLFHNLLKIVDPLNGKLMSSSCLQYNSIKAEWRRIRSEILRVEELVQSEIQMCFHSTADIAKLVSNKKAFDRWVNKFQTRIDFSIAKIIGQ